VHHLVNNPKATCFAPATVNTSIFLWEMLGTFLLIGVVFSTSGRKYRTTAPLAIGLALFTAAQAAGAYTGGAFNPVRYIANLGVGCTIDKAGYYVGGELLAAVAVVFVHYIQVWVATQEGLGQREDQLGVDMEYAGRPSRYA
jgi:glycerol uptake facilitator-like aquaporin